MLWLFVLPIAAYANIFSSRVPAFPWDALKAPNCESRLLNDFDREPLDSENGLITTSVELTAENAIEAYRRGIFAWGMARGSDTYAEWFNPPFRGILEINKFDIRKDVSSRDRQFILNNLESGEFQVTFDEAFEDVIRACATQARFRLNDRTGRHEPSSNWISERFIHRYTDLHNMGYAHSVEVWRDGELVAGLYGAFVDGVFSGESMFFVKGKGDNATKLAFYSLIERLKSRGHEFIDTQMAVGLAGKWGARYIPRDEYLRRMYTAQFKNLPY